MGCGANVIEITMGDENEKEQTRLATQSAKGPNEFGSLPSSAGIDENKATLRLDEIAIDPENTPAQCQASDGMRHYVSDLLGSGE
jgi:hypothetical protein